MSDTYLLTDPQRRSIIQRASQGDKVAGILYARDWRERNRAKFDAIYGPEVRCHHCGAAA